MMMIMMMMMMMIMMMMMMMIMIIMMIVDTLVERCTALKDVMNPNSFSFSNDFIAFMCFPG